MLSCNTRHDEIKVYININDFGKKNVILIFSSNSTSIKYITTKIYLESSTVHLNNYCSFVGSMLL